MQNLTGLGVVAHTNTSATWSQEAELQLWGQSGQNDEILLLKWMNKELDCIYAYYDLFAYVLYAFYTINNFSYLIMSTRKKKKKFSLIGRQIKEISSRC